MTAAMVFGAAGAIAALAGGILIADRSAVMSALIALIAFFLYFGLWLEFLDELGI